MTHATTPQDLVQMVVKIVKVQNLGFYSIFWRRADPRKYFKLNCGKYTHDDGAEVFPLEEILDELTLINPTLCDFCGEDLPGFPPRPDCQEYGRSNADRDDFHQVKQVVAWWSNNPDPGI